MYLGKMVEYGPADEVFVRPPIPIPRRFAAIPPWIPRV